MKIFIPGGAGYVGAKLVPALIGAGYDVIVYDLYMYGENVFENLKGNPHLKEVKEDIRNFKLIRKALEGCQAVIHLACISNDPSFELDPNLGKSINLDCFEPFVQLCKEEKIERFIYASSSSVYGVKEEQNVSEDMSLEPLTDYSRFKSECEKILFKYLSDDFIGTVLRPATVCGYSPRQRMDVVVNILTNLAYRKGKISVMGGDQMRPNIHIDDMVEAYIHVLKQPKEKVQGEIFNVGYHNHTVLELGKMIQRVVGSKKPIHLDIVPTNDNRSYHISSQKIGEQLGFFPTKTIEDAVLDLLDAFEQGKLPDSLEDKKYFNIKTMQALGLK